MNSLILISPDRAWGFKPILSGKREIIRYTKLNTTANWTRVMSIADRTFFARLGLSPLGGRDLYSILGKIEVSDRDRP